MISVFWSLMVDVFSPEQATRLFAYIAAGGALGAITGPLLTRLLVSRLGISGMLLLAAAGFGVVIALIHLLMREKAQLRSGDQNAQQSTLDHSLSGGALEGFRQLFGSRYALSQAAFMLLMTWVNTVAYFLQTDVVARSYAALASRAQALADIDLVVNVCTAAILIFGLGRIVQRFGVTAGLILNPLLMVVAFFATALSPTLLMIQGLQVVRRVAQYAIARPSREICFTVVEQSDRYKAKNLIDTVVYRFGDVSSAWMQAGLRSLGYGLGGAVAVGVGASLLWGAAAAHLGHNYEKLRRRGSAARCAEPAIRSFKEFHESLHPIKSARLLGDCAIVRQGRRRGTLRSAGSDLKHAVLLFSVWQLLGYQTGARRHGHGLRRGSSAGTIHGHAVGQPGVCAPVFGSGLARQAVELFALGIWLRSAVDPGFLRDVCQPPRPRSLGRGGLLRLGEHFQHAHHFRVLEFHGRSVLAPPGQAPVWLGGRGRNRRRHRRTGRGDSRWRRQSATTISC